MKFFDPRSTNGEITPFPVKRKFYFLFSKHILESLDQKNIIFQKIFLYPISANG